MYPKKEQLNTQRAYRNYFNFKTELFLRFIFKKIIETNILKGSIKLAHDNLLKKNTHLEYSYDNALVVFSNDLRDSFQFTLAMNLINATLNYCKEKN